MLAWMNNWDDSVVTDPYGWEGSMTLPRELFLMNHGQLGTRPVAELQGLRTKSYCLGGTYADGAHRLRSGVCMEIVAQFDVANFTAEEFGLRLRCPQELTQETAIPFRRKDLTLILDRSKSGIPSEYDVSAQVIPLNAGTLKLQVFLDVSAVEIFVNDGALTLSNRIYPLRSSERTFLSAVGGHASVDLNMWELRPTIHYDA